MNIDGTGIALLSLSVLFALLFLYPYVIYPLLLRFFPEHKAAAGHTMASDAPDCALLFCAYNEEDSLPEKIDNLRALKVLVPSLSIFAYSDCSSDGTNELLEAAADVLTPVLGTERLGKVLGMQKLVKMTDAEVLIFTDANVIVEPNSIPAILEYFKDPEIGTVAGTLIYTEEPAEPLAAVAKVGGLYWRLEEYIKHMESRSGSMMGADGSLFARRRSGYPEIPADLVDDMAVSMDSVIQGQRCISASDVVGFEQSVSNSSEEFRRKKRIACGSYSTYSYMKPQLRTMSGLNRFKFLSHKLIRWYGCAFLGLSILFFLAACTHMQYGAVLAAVALIAMLVVAVGGRQGVPLLATVYELLAAVIATAIGIYESVTGANYQTWNPAKSR